MGQRLRRGPYRVAGLIDLHDSHPGAFEATLIERGLRWRDVGSPGFRWSDLLALVEYLPWDAPLLRATKEDWRWRNPVYELLVTIAEETFNANVLRRRGHKTRKSDLLRVPRPWEKQKRETKLGGKPEPIGVIVTWLEDRMIRQRSAQITSGGSSELPESL